VIKRWSVPLGLAALVLVLGFPALSRYGVTWDEALGDFFFGERYLDYFLSFDQRYLDFAADPYPPEHRPDLSGSPFRNRPWEYYPVANVLAAATSRLLASRLGWLDPFDGFHAVNLFLGAALIASLYVYVRRRFDAIAALTAAVLLFTSPRIVADLLSNLKDTPEMAFFALTLLAFAAAFERGSAPGVIASGLLWGLALGTKANALFLPAIVLITVVVSARPAPWRGRTTALWASLAAFVIVGLATAFAWWPYLWGAPVERAREHLQYVGLRIFSTRPESVISPLQAIVYTTPLPFLGLSAAGAAIAARELASRARQPRFALPLAWTAVVLTRLHLPGAVNFDGVRHFLELFPALAILGGISASRLARWVLGEAADGEPVADGAAIPPPARSSAVRRGAAAALLALLLLPSVAAVARVHPFELAYWNAIAGGLDGARAKRLAQAGDYWVTSYRTGLEWVNANAERDAALAVPLAQHTVEIAAPVRLRPDVVLLDLVRPTSVEPRPEWRGMLAHLAQEMPVYVMFALRDDWTNELMRDCLTRLRPIQQWTVDGEPVLVIYRWTPALHSGG
jgi:hypothetical protein